MPYYQGDYYAGDYYAGDPGFFSGLVGFGKKLLGFGKAPAPLVGSAAGAGMAIQKAGREILARGGRVIAKHPVLSAAGAAGTIGVLTGGLGGRVGMVPAGQKGFHISKKTGRLVRNRRMRVTNPRALRRAIRRATGFAKLARRVLHFTSPRAPRGRAIFRKTRARGKMLHA